MSGSLNGKTGEWLRVIGGLVLAGLVSYFTAQNSVNERLTRNERDSEWIKATLVEIKGELKDQRQEIRDVVDDWRNGVDRRTGEPLPLQRAIEGQR